MFSLALSAAQTSEITLLGLKILICFFEILTYLYHKICLQSEGFNVITFEKGKKAERKREFLGVFA